MISRILTFHLFRTFPPSHRFTGFLLGHGTLLLFRQPFPQMLGLYLSVTFIFLGNLVLIINTILIIFLLLFKT